jgi:hypothetical protein
VGIAIRTKGNKNRSLTEWLKYIEDSWYFLEINTSN